MWKELYGEVAIIDKLDIVIENTVFPHLCSEFIVSCAKVPDNVMDDIQTQQWEKHTL